ncbi:MAG: M48 family metalloprotease [Desulfobacterales bacterium]|nr:M48 family metalloprotease [Desulfobacterales bacterium]
MNHPRFNGMLIAGLFIFFVTVSPCFGISILEERKLGQQFITMIKARQLVMADPIVNHMVRQVGNHLMASVKDQPFDYSFHVIDDSVFNAFAGPGANIFFYRGLITSLDTIDEFASIVGHEIAHAASRHVAESIQRSKYLNIGTLAGVLAGALIGSQTDGNAGSAVVQSTIALTQSAMLSFTRENETEADEKGIMLLKESCFDPRGLMGGLIKIRDADFRGIEQIPEYLKTHPGTGNRIAHVEAILESYVPNPNKPVCPEDFRFDMVKYRLLGKHAELEPTFKKLIALSEKMPENAAVHYGLGFLYERKFMPDKAMAHFKKGLSIHIFDPFILLEIGRLYGLDNQFERSLQVLAGLEFDPVVGVMARFHQAEARLELRDLPLAKSGFEFVINKASDAYPEAYLKLANIYSIERNQGLSSYNLGLYYYRIKREKAAMVHFTKALDLLEDKSKQKTAKNLLDKLKKRESERLKRR